MGYPRHQTVAVTGKVRRVAEDTTASQHVAARPDDIVGYTYNAENYTPAGVIEALIRDKEAAPAARDMDPEDALHQIAEANGIDWQDEHSFDSGDFPKVIFRDMLEPGEELTDESGSQVTASLHRAFDLLDEQSGVVGVDCPGSGAYVTASEVGGGPSPRALCDVCGQTVPVTVPGSLGGGGYLFVHLTPGKSLSDRSGSRRLEALTQEVRKSNPKITKREAAVIVRAAWNRYAG